MSTITQALSNPMVLIIVALAVFAAFQKSREMLKKYLASKSESETRNADAMNKLTAALEKWDVQESTKRAETLLAGTIKACEAIAVATDAHRKVVEAFSKTVFGNDKDALQQADDLERDKLYVQMQHRAAGKSPEEARILAENEVEQNDALQPSM